jgi:hypothetical protein
MEKVSEKTVIIDYKFIYDCPMNVLRGKFILVSFFYNLSHISEVTRNCWGILLDYKVVMTDDVL